MSDAGLHDADEALLERLLEGDHRALARAISRIEDRAPGYRGLVSALYGHTGNATVVGITGSPGAGKSTLVDKLAEHYRERGETVGVVAIDPSSPFSGGAVLGDRIRMASTVGDMDVFVRSMSARGRLGGLSSATADAVVAMDAFGKDRILVETVGAGQNEIDVVRTADTVVVLVPPGAGDTVQTLKAGILEIADCFVVNKADREGADRTVQELQEMLQVGAHGPGGDGGTSGFTAHDAGHHGVRGVAGHDSDPDGDDHLEEGWSPPVLETVATRGTGLSALLESLEDHRTYLERSGELAARRRARHGADIEALLRDDLGALVARELETVGGVDALAEAVADGRSDPYRLVDALVEPLERCLADEDVRDRAEGDLEALLE
ncbi:methylmalonyl Co-A mutase-associated GTPase MeaB [Natronobiforma cellulositropha]|uniref:methylmalonyl Co-A mutase-associated GTPase MeaB n=1 Tax=Natronobiforma cellulositropha TaxID=1679076 RepID=UPI0021D58494|nr:methylmalonyl Co-A mutase-associated GTPase MeaB [Natronobiforma cellulositropha]